MTESTYGNRLHKKTDSLEDLANAINETHKRGGVVLIPAFAVGRAQALMHDLFLLKQQNRILDFPMYLNSPMAINASNIFCDYSKLQRLSDAQCTATCDVVKYVRSAEESKALKERKSSAADEFRRRLTETFGWQCFVPAQDELVRLE